MDYNPSTGQPGDDGSIEPLAQQQVLLVSQTWNYLPAFVAIGILNTISFLDLNVDTHLLIAGVKLP